jgi:hypothetical protein
MYTVTLSDVIQLLIEKKSSNLFNIIIKLTLARYATALITLIHVPCDHSKNFNVSIKLYPDQCTTHHVEII